MTYSHGSSNRLASVGMNGATLASYVYNSQGERVCKWIGGNPVRYVYDTNGKLLGKYGADDKPIAEYIYLDDLPVAVWTQQGLAYIETDHLGTPRVIVDAGSNQALWRWPLTGGAFGDHHPDTDPHNTGTPYIFSLRYPGQYYDTESGLHYNDFRDYEPGTGRYIQSDPIGSKGGVSTYAYARSSPLRLVDPKGLEGQCPEDNCCIKVKIWICERPINAWYGSIVPNHKYVCCNGPNSVCYGHQANNLKAGDPIPSEGDPSGTCREVEVCQSLKDKKCNNPASPRDAGTVTWNCRDWAEWDGK